MNGKSRRKSVKLYRPYAGVNWLEHYTAYEGTPPVTRFFGTACFLVNIATFFGLINVFHFVFDLQSVLQKHEYWRFLTSFLHFGFAFGSPVGFIYPYSIQRHECHRLCGGQFEIGNSQKRCF